MSKKKRTSKNRVLILDVLSKGHSLSKAAQAAGMGRETLYRWRMEDSKFNEEVEQAIEAGTDLLEDALFDKGKKLDDKAAVTAALATLKARRPEKWREYFRHEMSGPGGGPMQVEQIERTVVDPADVES